MVTVSPSCIPRITDPAMMLNCVGRSVATVSLDFREQFGESVELECFQFLIASH